MLLEWFVNRYPEEKNKAEASVRCPGFIGFWCVGKIYLLPDHPFCVRQPWA